MVRVKVTESCTGRSWWISIYDGKKELMLSAGTGTTFGIWERKYAAIRNAKAMAKRIGIPYSDEIIKQRGC